MVKEEPRIGVFVCHCGLNIAKTVNVKEVRDYAAKLPYVVYASDQEFTCSEAGQKTIKDAIKEHKLNRVVVASCSPKLHELTFRRCVAEAGLNPFLFEMVNIREHVSWAHMHEPEKATEKAKHLVRAAVERAALLEEIGTVSASVIPSVLVIGGGVAGIEAAIGLADYGFDVYLVERSPTLGGKAFQLGKVFPTEDCGVCTAPRNSELHRKCLYKAPILTHPKIKVYTLATIKSLEGYVGNFKATISLQPRYVNPQLCIGCGKCAEVCPVEVPNEYDVGLSKRKAIYLPSTQALPPVYTVDMANCTKCGKCVEVCPTKAINLDEQPSEVTLDVGAIVVAVGFEEYEPKGLYGFGEYSDVITQLKLSRMLDSSGPTKGEVVKPSNQRKPKKIVMVQCVGSRDKSTHIYCSKICCAIALKNARSILQKNPDTEITICYKDIRLAGKDYEHYYVDCQNMGVNFINGDVLEVKEDTETKMLKLKVKPKYGEEVELEADLVVLTCALIPAKGMEELARTLNLSLSPDGFFMELHPKLAPVDTNVDGIYICGACHGPKDIHESINQAKAVVSRVATLLAPGKVEVDLAKSIINEDLCIGCGNCVAKCPYKAIEFTPYGTARVIEIACKGCGVCVVECPARAIQLRHYKDDQIFATVSGVLKEV
ncbi:disulfide reductase [Candidatus Bathyarchaeota archaeon]|nr:MAG: disulfide reductase [Candidatus Bathyarchaeota archaeon]